MLERGRANLTRQFCIWKGQALSANSTEACYVPTCPGMVVAEGPRKRGAPNLAPLSYLSEFV